MRRAAFAFVLALAGLAAFAASFSVRLGARDLRTAAGPSRTAFAAASRVAPSASEPVAPSSAALEAYRRSSVYPPTSRPLRASDRHRIEWNRRHERPRPAACDPALSLLFSGDRYQLVGDDALEAFAELGGTRAFAVHSARAEVIDSVSGTRSEPHPIDFAARGRRANTRFVPAELGLEQPARIRLTVAIECAGQIEERALNVIYTPEAAVPARFTGSFRDGVEDGSLVIHAGIDVKVPGWFLIDANLHDAQDRPVAWARFKGELAPGAGSIALGFFGKVLLDAGAEPPFSMRELRGARFAEGRDPDLEPMPAHPHAHVADCELDELSDAEWDAPEKTAKLEMLEREARDPTAPRITLAE